MKDWIGQEFLMQPVGTIKVTEKVGDLYIAGGQRDEHQVTASFTEPQLIAMYEQDLIEAHPGILLDLMSLSKDNRWTIAQMEAIEYPDFERYVDDNSNWSHPYILGNFYMANKLHSDSAHFPASKDFADYAMRVGDCIVRLAEADHRSLMSVYLELRWKVKE